MTRWACLLRLIVGTGLNQRSYLLDDSVVMLQHHPRLAPTKHAPLSAICTAVLASSHHRAVHAAGWPLHSHTYEPV